jgi:hypothetical protein
MMKIVLGRPSRALMRTPTTSEPFQPKQPWHPLLRRAESLQVVVRNPNRHGRSESSSSSADQRKAVEPSLVVSAAPPFLDRLRACAVRAQSPTWLRHLPAPRRPALRGTTPGNAIPARQEPRPTAPIRETTTTTATTMLLIAPRRCRPIPLLLLPQLGGPNWWWSAGSTRRGCAGRQTTYIDTHCAGLYSFECW